MVFGDKQKHLVALLTLDEQPVCDFAREQNWEFDSYFGGAHSNFVAQEVIEIAMRSAGLADYEHVKRFAILSNELSVEAGELTATLKIKRNVVARNYQPLIENLYHSPEPALENRRSLATAPS